MNSLIFRSATWSLAAAGFLMQMSFSAHADEASAVQAQLDALTRRLEQLEKRQSAPASSSPASGAVTGGDIPGSFKLPGSNTSVKLGGYAKLDAVFSDKSAGVGSTADLEYEAGAVPVGPTAGANERNQVKLHARQSRFFLQTSTPSNW